MRIVFLVDDDPDDRYLLREAIRAVDQDVEIIEATDGLDLADKIVLQPPASISLVLLDMNMPKMNGLETIYHIKGIRSLHQVPLVMVSTSSHGTIKAKALDAGSDLFFAKPNSFELFIDLARDLKKRYFA